MTLPLVVFGDFYLNGIDLMKRLLLHTLFRPHHKTRQTTVATRRRTAAQRLRQEHLEQRLALAVNIFASPLAAPWSVIAADRGSDIHLQQVATAPQNLLIADNPAFNGYQTVADVDTSVTTLLITNGTKVSVADIPHVGLGDTTTTSFLMADASDRIYTATTNLFASGLFTSTFAVCEGRFLG